jgi:hypothetical protein
MAGNPEINLTNEAHPRAMDRSAGPWVTQPSATLCNPTLEGSEASLIKNSDEELEYLQCKETCLEKQRKI